MTEVLTIESVTTDTELEQLEQERYDFIKSNLAATAVYFAATLAESTPKPYDIGTQHLPADVYND